MDVKLKLLRPYDGDATPIRGSAEAAGWDVRYAGAVPLRIWAQQIVKVPLGFALELPPGAYVSVNPRSSSLPTRRLHIALGTIDSDYRGEIMAVVMNLSAKGVETLQPFERIAQIIFHQHAVPVFSDEAFTPSLRDAAGFGSTGVR